MSTPPIRVLAISGSLRARSSNRELLRAAESIGGVAFAFDHLESLDQLPHFNPDLDIEGAVPPAAVDALRRTVGAADVLLISSPEYAHGVPGSLKNALDWLVSGPEMVGKPFALLNASGRSHFAHASIAETLRTMSALPVSGGDVVVPIDGRRLTADAIVADAELASIIRGALGAIADHCRANARAIA